MRRGMRRRSITAWAATVSVGETTAPRMKQAAHGRSGKQAFATRPTISVVAATRPMASMAIGRNQRRKSSQDDWKASA